MPEVSLPHMECVRVSSNPNMADDDRKHPMTHWQCTLTHGYGKNSLLTVFFSCGSGFKGKRPAVESVLSCLISDGSACDMTFEDFCCEMGYDTDSRKALETYLACQKNGSDVRRLLGRDYDDIAEAVRDL